MNDHRGRKSRRWFVKAGSVASAALGLGAIGTAGGQESSSSNDGSGQFREAITTGEMYFSGEVFRVVSPPLQDAPVVDNPDVLRNHSVRVIQHFNTNREGYLFVPRDVQIEEGAKYVFDDRLLTPPENELGITDLVRVRYRPLTEADLPFELEINEDFEILDDDGGEAAVRPENFFSSAPFRITSGPQGWVPQDIEQSGLFTDYETVHAEYFGTNDRFLFFPQEGSETEQGELYVLRDESELFDPAGNLVAAEFDAVDEESLRIDDSSLR
ncbi:twin-arginine translocation signal domain-containing protein [Haloterrigena salifodinae]|uniref:twin-arginine translocation signal domain-containing protein n=1 Tax=Haloterrigena salifodinae TaxID=2675099 RepID=UPI000F87406B|nr:twin-arginine translocation signal domain-containing protein [Haloterrigena salifodinae]